METMKDYVMNGFEFTTYLKACFNPTVVHYTIILILLAVALGLAAWKARKWVRPIGRIVMTLNAFILLDGFRQLCDCAQWFGAGVPEREWSNLYIAQGMRPFLFVAVSGVIIYLISLLVSIAQKPRI